MAFVTPAPHDTYPCDNGGKTGSRFLAADALQPMSFPVLWRPRAGLEPAVQGFAALCVTTPPRGHIITSPLLLKLQNRAMTGGDVREAARSSFDVLHQCVDDAAELHFMFALGDGAPEDFENHGGSISGGPYQIAAVRKVGG